MNINALRQDLSIKCKNGLNFVLAGAVTWLVIFGVWHSEMVVPGKTTWTFMAGGIMFPLALGIGRLIKAELSVKDNPLSPLGLYITFAQMLYFPLVFWAFYNSPYDMPMFLAIVTGAHFLPFAWFYMSKAYMIMSGVSAVLITAIGWNLAEELTWTLPLYMAGLLLILAGWLYVEYLAKVKQTVASGQARM